jgi:hypothetical protein
MKTLIETGHQMNETILNYPGFQNLPKGVKRMLLASETHFFDQPASHCQYEKPETAVTRVHRHFTELLTGQWVKARVVLQAPV